MIEYQFKEEKDYALGYAKRLNRPEILLILHRGYVASMSEAQALSMFFWQMVDKSIEDDKTGTSDWPESASFWHEKLLHSFSGHLEAVGYLEIWEQVQDQL